MKKLKFFFCTLLVAIMCSTFVGCADKPVTPGGEDTIPPVVPPVVDTSQERLTDYLETTLFYDMAMKETVKAVGTNATYIAYKDGDAVYAESTLKGSTILKHSKGIYKVFKEENIEGDAEYTIVDLDSVLCNPILYLPLYLSKNIYEDEADVIKLSRRTDTYVQNADKTKTLTFEYERDFYYVKLIFNFTAKEKLSRIEFFSLGKGKVQDINFTYGEKAPTTIQDVKNIQIDQVGLSCNLLLARNTAIMRAKGKLSRLDNFKISASSIVTGYEGADEIIPTHSGEVKIDLIEKGGHSFSSHEEKLDGVSSGKQVIYADADMLYIDNSVGKSAFPLSHPSMLSLEYSNESLMKQLLPIVFQNQPDEIVKTTENENEAYTATEDTITTKVVFDKKGRMLSRTETSASIHQGIKNSFFFEFKFEYNIQEVVTMPAAFADYQLTDKDKAYKLLLEIIGASGGKNLLSSGGIIIKDDRQNEIRMSFDSDMLVTGDIVNDETENTHSIYGGYIADNTKPNVESLSSIFNDFFGFYKKIPYNTARIVMPAFSLTCIDEKGNTLMSIAHKPETMQVFSFDNGGQTFYYAHQKVDKVTINQDMIDYINFYM